MGVTADNYTEHLATADTRHSYSLADYENCTKNIYRILMSLKLHHENHSHEDFTSIPLHMGKVNIHCKLQFLTLGNYTSQVCLELPHIPILDKQRSTVKIMLYHDTEQAEMVEWDNQRIPGPLETRFFLHPRFSRHEKAHVNLYLLDLLYHSRATTQDSDLPPPAMPIQE